MIIDAGADVLALLQSPHGQNHLYDIYDRLREHEPVHRTPSGVHVLTRYADCSRVLRAHDEFHSPDIAHDPRAQKHLSIRTLLSGNLLGMGPPEHTRLRGFVTSCLTPGVVAGLRARVTELCDELLTELWEKLHAGETVDLHAEVSLPLPLMVFCELLGVSTTDRGWYASALAAALKAGNPAATADDLVEADIAVGTMLAYLRAIVRARREKPATDLISRLVSIRDGEHSGLTEDELIVLCFEFLIGGFESTAAALSNGMLFLIGNPDWPAFGPDHVKELLRLDSPTQCHPGIRVAAHDVRLGDVVVPRGTEVRAMIGAANRDPAVFADPARFLLGREGPPPLTFGAGIHFCPASGLAQMEMTVLLTKFARQVHRTRLTAHPVRRRTILLRTFDSLHVKAD